MIWRVRGRGTFEALGRARARAAGPIRLRRVSVEPGPPQVAYAVGRRIGGAVRRNRIRRRLRETVRAHAALLEDGTAYLFGAGSGVAEMSHEALSAAVAELLGNGERP